MEGKEAAQLQRREVEALGHIESFLRGAGTRCRNWEPWSETLAPWLVDSLPARLPPDHLGQALARAVWDVGGGVLTSAVSLVGGAAVLGPLAGLGIGRRACAFIVAASIRKTVRAPVVATISACREICLGVAATPGAIASSLVGEDSCAGERKRLRSLKVAIAPPSHATRGDIQPVMALALQLQHAGAAVKIFVKEDVFSPIVSMHVSAIGSLGLDVHTYATLGEMYDLIKAFSPAILLHRFTQLGLAWVVEEQLGIRRVEYNMWPEPNDTGYRYHILDAQRQVLSKHLGVSALPDVTLADVDADLRARPFLYAFSAEVAGCDAGAPLGSVPLDFQCFGYWDFPEDRQERFFRSAHVDFFGSDSGRELEAFLAAGEPPVYIGWGSMTNNAGVSMEVLAALAVRTLRLVGRRGIILGSYGNMRDNLLATAGPDAPQLQEYSNERVLWARWVPHQWLLPRCRAAVHHGGASTAASSLRAGAPTVVTPVMLDQFFWGVRVKRLGVGDVTTELKTISAETLATALRMCEADEVVERARALGERLRTEDGAVAAAQWILDHAPGAHARKMSPPSEESRAPEETTGA